jgi:hypothetical protein
MIIWPLAGVLGTPWYVAYWCLNSLLKNPAFDVQPLQEHLIFEIYGIAKAMS